MQNDELKVLRGEIDAVDEELIRLLGKRLDICRQVALVKRENRIQMMQPDRVKYVKERISNLADGCRVDPNLALAIYDKIIQAACDLETNIISNETGRLNGGKSG